MIYTLTLNPSLDYAIRMDHFTWGVRNRTSAEEIRPGGKGINISVVLTNLNVANIALGFIAGHTGEMLEQLLTERGVVCDFTRIARGYTRINLNMRGYLATLGTNGPLPETEVEGFGPQITDSDISALLAKLGNLREGDILVLSGEVPPSMPADTYARILVRLQDKGVRVVIDAPKDVLIDSLRYRPFLIKPNDDEIAQIFDCDASDESILFAAAAELQKQGAGNVLISRGPRGAVMLDATGARYAGENPEGELVNPVGAGDSMVAGFLAGLDRIAFEGVTERQAYAHAFKVACASGSATAYSEGFATLEKVKELLMLIGVEDFDNAVGNPETAAAQAAQPPVEEPNPGQTPVVEPVDVPTVPGAPSAAAPASAPSAAPIDVPSVPGAPGAAPVDVPSVPGASGAAPVDIPSVPGAPGADPAAR